MSKEALAERTLAEQQERRLAPPDEALIWRMRAEAAETCLQERQASNNHRELSSR